MTSDGSRLPTLPLVDARAGGLVSFALTHHEAARALRDACVSFFPRPLRGGLPLLDRLARRWLRSCRSPYVPEIASIAERLGFSGIWFLNGSYQWGCTALAREEQGAAWLARTLDWPFAGLGRHAAIVEQAGPAGCYLSVTWPGYVGVLSAMAPGRFAACVNQAPLRRRTRRAALRMVDMAANALATWTAVRHIPPDHLLRAAFETCRSFEEAKVLLEQTPVARPVIYVLVGCRAEERCVIERVEEAHETRSGEIAAANDWQEPRPGWEARIAARHFFRLSFAEAAENSRARALSLAQWRGSLAGNGFEWLAPPVLNPYTRLALVMCPAEGRLGVVGCEPAAGEDLPSPATQPSVLHRPPNRKPTGPDPRFATAVS